MLANPIKSGFSENDIFSIKDRKKIYTIRRSIQENRTMEIQGWSLIPLAKNPQRWCP
jgi:hypothetical protein